MSLEAWQIALRRQFAAELRLKIRNLGREPVFSEFAVTNPRTNRTYRLAIRGDGLGKGCLLYCRVSLRRRDDWSTTGTFGCLLGWSDE